MNSCFESIIREVSILVFNLQIYAAKIITLSKIILGILTDV